MTPIYIVEFKAEPGSLISTLIKPFVPDGFTHTGLRVGNLYYEVDPTKGKVYNVFDLTDPCCDYLKKNGHRMEFYKLGEFDDITCFKIENWWDVRIKSQPPFSYLRFLTFPIDIARRKFYELKFRLTGKATKTIFDALCPSAEVCSTAVDKSLSVAGLDILPCLDSQMAYPGSLSLGIRDKRVYFECHS